MCSNPKSLRDWMAELVGNTQMRGALRLRFGACRVSVETNDTDLLGALLEYYQEFLGALSDPIDIAISVVERKAPALPVALAPRTPDPGRTWVKDEYADLADGRIVRKRLTGMLFLFGDGQHLAVGPCCDNLNQVVNFVNNRYVDWVVQSGHLLCPASAVTFAGRGLVIGGFTGTGKSTLALKLLECGFDLVSHDRLMLGHEGDALRGLGVAKLPRVNPGTILHNPRLHSLISPDALAWLATLTDDALWRMEQKHDVPLKALYGAGRFVLSTPVVGICLLTWRPGAGKMRLRRVELAKRPELLEALRKPRGLFLTPSARGGTPDPGAEDYLRWIGACPVYELSGGVDFETAAHALHAFARTGEMPSSVDPGCDA